MASLGTCADPYCDWAAVAYVFGHHNRLTVVRATDSRAHLLARSEQHGAAGGRCVQHLHDAIDVHLAGEWAQPFIISEETA